MQLKTKRLLTRELVPEDWQHMQKIAADFRKSEYAIYDMPLPVEDGEIIALTRQFAETQMFYAVLLHDVMIGYICFHEDNGKYDLGYCFHSDYQGRGYAFESCCAMMNYLSDKQGIKIFTAGTALENKPSRKLLERLGFTLQKTERLSFQKDINGNDITFEGGIFIKREGDYPASTPSKM